MITVVAGTNRQNSNSEKVASKYAEMLSASGAATELLLLKDLPADFAFVDVFGEKRMEMNDLISRYFSKAEKFVFIVPEYNGGFPGVLKSLIDAVPTEDFRDKKAGLIGLSAGRTGGLMPMDQLTSILNYLRVSVHFCKPKLSSIQDLMNDDGDLTDEPSIALLQEHAEYIKNF